jgi:hypothetical protein
MNNKSIAILSIMMLALAGNVLACHEKIVVKDDQGTPMQGVLVELTSDCGGWSAATDTTDASGTSTNWNVHPYTDCWYYGAVVSGADGYVCTENQHYNYWNAGTINLVCTPAEEVPEFGVLAAFGVLALAGLFIYKKRG